MSNPADRPEIVEAYDAVRSDKSDVNWLLINYADAKGDALVLADTGTGGLSELKTKFDPDEAQYA